MTGTIPVYSIRVELSEVYKELRRRTTSNFSLMPWRLKPARWEMRKTRLLNLPPAPSSGGSESVLGAVVYPDFSQIESDAAQISVNNTFSIFYPEKRPFLLEGADLFGTLASAFYSRMINNPLGASRLTQKSGSFSLAYLVAYDRESPFIVPGEEGSDFVGTSERSLSNVARSKYDFGSESFIG